MAMQASCAVAETTATPPGVRQTRYTASPERLFLAWEDLPVTAIILNSTPSSRINDENHKARTQNSRLFTISQINDLKILLFAIFICIIFLFPLQGNNVFLKNSSCLVI
jgi:hypothetical protein